MLFPHLLCFALSDRNINQNYSEPRIEKRNCAQYGFNKIKLTTLQVDKRINFAKKQLEGEIKWDSEVVITNESRFCLESDSRRVWMRRGVYNKKTFREKTKFSKSIMVWDIVRKKL